MRSLVVIATVALGCNPRALPGNNQQAASALWAVGGNQAAGAVGLRFDGQRWTSSSQFPSTTTAFLGVWGVSAADMWMVGADGTIAHYDGTTWSACGDANSICKSSGTGNALYAIHGVAADDILAVGESGAVHWDGRQWQPRNIGFADHPSPLRPILRGVWCAASVDCWAVSDQGTAIHWDGSAWSAELQILGAGRARSIWGTSSSNVWAVGLQNAIGAIAHWDGKLWSVATTTPHELQAVWGASPQDVWAAGLSGAILHWDGSMWSNKPSPTNADFHAAWGASATDVWIAGDTTIVHWDGANWSLSPTDLKVYTPLLGIAGGATRTP